MKDTRGWLSDVDRRVDGVDSRMERMEELAAEREARALESRAELATNMGKLGGDVVAVRKEFDSMKTEVTNGIGQLLRASLEESQTRDARSRAAKLEEEEAEKKRQEREEKTQKAKHERFVEAMKTALLVITAIGTLVIGAITALRGNPPSVTVPQPYPQPVIVPSPTAGLPAGSASPADIER